jgi:hypothetical protein
LLFCCVAQYGNTVNYLTPERLVIVQKAIYDNIILLENLQYNSA